MKRSSSFVASPVISLLSSSPAMSRRAQELFRTIFALHPLALDDCPAGSTEGHHDDLDRMFHSRIPGLSRRWDSVASQCQSSGAIVHLLSMKKPVWNQDESSGGESSDGKLSLLTISRGPLHTGADMATKAVWESRHLIASHMIHRPSAPSLVALRLSLVNAVGRSITASQILGTNDGLPLMDLPRQDQDIWPDQEVDTESTGLKEVAIPHYDDAQYTDGSTLVSKLSSSTLERPVVGVYQWPSHSNGVAFRPLPAAKEDLLLPPPSLVFRCASLDRVEEKLIHMGASSAKIGFNGMGFNGQLMVRHKDLNGLDIRFCETNLFSSSFFEAEEALLASSLDELQSTNVMLEGGKGNTGSTTPKKDTMNGLGDCWVEVRANLKRPSGFLKRSRASKGNSMTVDGRPRAAKAPDIPYE